MLVLDAGAVSALSTPTRRIVQLIAVLRSRGAWQPIVPSPVLIECLRDDPARDARANRLLRTCEILPVVPERLARRAAGLRRRAGRGSAIDALVMASAEPDGVVITTDAADLRALSSHARSVTVIAV